jgi:hypothetical protein
MKLFKRNGYLLDTLNPSETLYTVAFGIKYIVPLLFQVSSGITNPVSKATMVNIQSLEETGTLPLTHMLVLR